MYADIVLHRRVPGHLDSFTYRVPEKISLQPGQLVQVPFRKQTLSGIVRQLHQKTPAYPTKLVENALPIWLESWQIELANWICDFYKCSFSKTIDFFIPEKIWPKHKKKNSPACPAGRQPKEAEKIIKKTKKMPLINQETENFARYLLRNPSKKLLIEKTPLNRNKFYSALQKVLPAESQALFLFPEIFYIQKLAKNLPQFHGGLSESQKAEIWKAVKEGEIKTISATRPGLFLPFKKLGCIVLDFEHHESYREIRQPNYDSLAVAEKLAEIWNIPLIAISEAPRTTTFHKTKTCFYEKFEWNSKQEKTPEIKIIDMADERRKGNFGIFAENTIHSIANCLIKKEQVLLFINRKGEASAMFCRDCGNISRCPRCSSPFTIHKENVLKCHRCKIAAPIPEKCEKCSGLNLKTLGAGTEKIEEEIKKIFGRAKILRLDSETLNKKNKMHLDEKTLRESDILVATRIIDKPLNLPRMALGIAVMPDPLINISDFRAEERLFQLFTRIKNMSKNKTIIQTYIPNHSLYENFSKNLFENFYEEQLNTRKTLSLPPFGNFNAN